ncbi:MAG: YkgJ family cysteine cluster protein [Spirochaetia bacterium]|nr:YkgJ family cysteine cluster protein [Spirochaetia bacterium]MCF7946834.1 YkgJ family cysteine cluster protein [Spirochaetia bacterium]
MSAFYDEGLQFECQRCSYCCRNEPGYVFLSSSDMQAIADFLGISEETFLNTYCKTISYNHFGFISLKEKTNNDCIFWREEGCAIYKVRPIQCRTYPFWANIIESQESWDNESNFCPGIGKGSIVKKKEILKKLKMRENNSPLMV